VSKAKTYHIDARSTVKAAVRGHTVNFTEWRYVGQLQATRAAKALRKAEAAFPGRWLRARLITGQFSGGAR